MGSLSFNIIQLVGWITRTTEVKELEHGSSRRHTTLSIAIGRKH
jgi:hypothetical protein